MWPDQPHINLSWSSARARLGGTEAALLVDFGQGVNPDALAAALGVVQGGGLVLFCLPPTPPPEGKLKEQLTVWPRDLHEVGHRFWQTLWDACTAQNYFSDLECGVYCSHVSTVNSSHREVARTLTFGDQSNPVLPLDLSSLSAQLNQILVDHPAALKVIESGPISREQQEVILTALISYHRQAFSALALSALRGRGKSSALGLIAAVFLLTGVGEVGLTAPSIYSVKGVFAQAQRAFNLVGVESIRTDSGLRSTVGVLRYWTPQQLWTRQARPSLLLVDEAAALPVPLLERLLEWRPSLIFATTTHGYEGTGRGFSLRFRPFLQQKLRKLYEPQLTQPLRWSAGDPVEAWMMSALALDADVSLTSRELDCSQYRYERLSTDDLMAYPLLTREIFALLIHAHYRTQPSDLWRLFDAPNLTLHVLRLRETQPTQPGFNTPDLTQSYSSCADAVDVLAVALTSTEGGLTAELAAQVYEGRVRPRGQLFAANLAVHLNHEEGAQLRLERVVRIATLPTQQGRGVGTRLLTEIIHWARSTHVDLLGSSFGATDQLTRFWLRSGFVPLRVGVRQSHVSGERSLLVAQALSTRAQSTLDTLKNEWKMDFEEQLRGALATLDPSLVYTLSTSLNTSGDVQDRPFISLLSERNWRALGAVAFSGRAYELASGSARLLALHWLASCPRSDTSTVSLAPLGRLVITKVIQGQRWLEVTADLGLGSTSEAMKGLSASLRLLYVAFAPEWARRWVKRFPQYDRPAKLCAQLKPLQLIHTFQVDKRST